MALYDILKDREAVNMLKVLYDNEMGRKSYSMPLGKILQEPPFQGRVVGRSVELLERHDLIAMDLGEQKNLCITERGKRFIQLIDGLREVLTEQQKPIKSVRIEYSLTQRERQLLTIIYQMGRELGEGYVGLRAITVELYPYEDYPRKSSLVSQYVGKLEKLHLVEKKKIGRNIFITVTARGKEIVQEQYMQELASK
ncbi:hypothetical protein HYS48_01440 [Candidatus Woesearchaeota archaeon]|nr:hypothetical protein [Candidatus Woesearchaeota archaeon]